MSEEDKVISIFDRKKKVNDEDCEQKDETDFEKRKKKEEAFRKEKNKQVAKQFGLQPKSPSK